MSAPTGIAVHVFFAVVAIIVIAYAAGRVHQWYRHGFEREVAYRQGYNEASHALFHLATRPASARRTAVLDHDKITTMLPRVGVS